VVAALVGAALDAPPAAAARMPAAAVSASNISAGR
jgi:hypothetical protein